MAVDSARLEKWGVWARKRRQREARRKRIRGFEDIFDGFFWDFILKNKREIRNLRLGLGFNNF